MREGQVDATFTVTSGSREEVLGENRVIEVKKGEFNDNFFLLRGSSVKNH